MAAERGEGVSIFRRLRDAWRAFIRAVDEYQELDRAAEHELPPIPETEFAPQEPPRFGEDR